MALRQRAPWPTLAAALLCLLVALVLWSTARKSRKIILAAVHSRNAATSKAFTQFWRPLSSAPVSGAFDGTTIRSPDLFSKDGRERFAYLPKTVCTS